MAKNYALLIEQKNSEFVVLDYNEYGEEIETTLPDNIKVYTEINDKDLQEGMRNAYCLPL